MFRALFFSVLITLQLFSQLQKSGKDFSLVFQDRPLRNVLNEIMSKTGTNFIYKDDLVDKILITAHLDMTAPENAVKNLLSKYGIGCRKFEKNYFVLFRLQEIKEIKNIYKATLIEQPASNFNPAVLLFKPKLISKMNPVYPPEAVRNDIEGNVRLKILVTKEGNIAKALITSTSGSLILDSAAVRHAVNLKFIPAEENGKPANVWVAMIFRYQITGKDISDPFKK